MSTTPATPVIKKNRWARLIWLVPLFAAIGAGFYIKMYILDRGPLITIKFKEADGLRAGESHVLHRGAFVGKVESIKLSKDQKEALVDVRLEREQSAFSHKGAEFWVVRPEISDSGIKGFNTLLSGPYINANPGEGKPEREFEALPSPPEVTEEGLDLVLHAPELGHVQEFSPVFYRGIQVGTVRSIHLAHDANEVQIHVVIWRRYSALVRTQTKFWVANGFDFSGGLLTGAELKINSIKTLISGGVAFATPDKNMGDPVKDGADFQLESSSQKDWKNWAPKIPLQ